MHWLEFKMKTVDRQTTKGQWKAISRWLREYRNKVELQISLTDVVDAMRQQMGLGR